MNLFSWVVVFNVHKIFFMVKKCFEIAWETNASREYYQTCLDEVPVKMVDVNQRRDGLNEMNWTVDNNLSSKYYTHITYYAMKNCSSVAATSLLTHTGQHFGTYILIYSIHLPCHQIVHKYSNAIRIWHFCFKISLVNWFWNLFKYDKHKFGIVIKIDWKYGVEKNKVL